MRIVHLSDLHLEKTTKQDYIDHILIPLINNLYEENEIKAIDIILITGDLINHGGQNYINIKESFEDFALSIIDPIVKSLSLSRNQVFFVPGNHDINRSRINPIFESGLKNTLTSETAVSSFITSPQSMERIEDFKQFEQEYYKDFLNCQLTQFQSSFKVRINQELIGITCLNSAWRCYKSEDDKNHLIIGEKQLISATNFLNDCSIKIAISHHHPDWLTSFDEEAVNNHLMNNYHLFFCGHNHRTKSYFYQDPDGQLFVFCASGMLSPNLKTLKSFDIGYSIVDYDLLEEKISVTYKKADYNTATFFTNSALGKNGVWVNKIPVGEGVLKLIEEKKLLKQIREEALPSLDKHLLTYGTETNAPQSIDSLFVMPTLVSKDEYNVEKEATYIEDVKELLLAEDNYIIFGVKESGKTILLDKIISDAILDNKRYRIIPAYIDFAKDWNEIISEIKIFWGKSSSDTKEILSEHKVLLLVDNMSFEEEDIYKLKNIKNLLNNFKYLRFIGSYRQLYEDDIPGNLEILNILNFQKLNLKQFKAKQIKLLIQKWFPTLDKIEAPKKLETLTNAFLTLNLPRTPFAVSMFLWIIEKQERFKPINNSILIENFIEKLLNKHDPKESLREKFGYDNKIWILSEVAYKMLKKDDDNYALDYVNYINCIDDYLKLKKFEDFETNNIADILLKTGILIKHNGDIRFRFNCFFEFFLVKRMQFYPDFLKEVLHEDNYLQYVNEIDYYTGLFRGQSEIVSIIFKRLEEEYRELDDLIEEKVLRIPLKSTDDFFIQRDENGEEKPSIISQLDESKVRKFLPGRKPTEEDLEVIEDKKLDMTNTEKGISKKQRENNYKELGKLLVLSMKVLKNSEEISIQDLKMNCYSSLLKRSISYAILTKALLEDYLRHKETIPANKLNEMIGMNTYLPLLHQILIFDNLGTLKLSSVIRDKIELDKVSSNVSEFEKFLSIFLYADIRGKESEKYINDIIKKSRVPFIIDNIFFKLITYYFYRSRDPQSDDKYLNMITDLLIQSKGYRKYDKGNLMRRYRIRKFHARKRLQN